MGTARRIIVAIALLTAMLNAAEAPSTPQPIKSYRHLLRLLKARDAHFLNQGGGGGPELTGGFAAPTANDALAGATLGAAATKMAAPAGGTDAPPSSVTNAQVAGVEEADIVKNDGEFIYSVNRERVLVIKAFPDNQLAVQSTLSFDSEFYPLEIFIDVNRLIVIGSGYRTEGVERPFLFWPGTVRALVFDTGDKSNLKQIRTVEIDGSYLSSRKIDQSIYLVARKYPDFYFLPMMALGGGVGVGGTGTGTVTGTTTAPRAVRKPRRRNTGIIPAIKDSAKGAHPIRIDPNNIYYFPDFTEPDYLLVAGFNLNDDAQPASAKVFLGAGDAVYCSMQNLYVADTKFPIFWGGPVPLGAATGINQPAGGKDNTTPPVETTGIYRFALDKGNVTFNARGEVPGSITNQFEMDENNGFFRVATTLNDWTNGGTSNNVYVLDGDMKITGKLEGLAPGERIFSTRFVGDRCYLVTFHMVDPLFVIGLSDPTAPTVLGQLKIPGFSDYLQPYDETHIIGFGKDTVDGLYQGMKIACFDVSDVNNPVQVSSVSIGDRGTSSEVLYDHRALLFDKSKNLIAFPIMVTQIQNKTADTPLWTWGDPVFNGAYVYNFTLETGFVFRAGITHQTPEQTAAWYFSGMIRRLLYIGDDLYTVSQAKVQVHDLNTLGLKQSLDLP